MIAAAQTNGGKLNSAHKEFANGYVFAIRFSGDYVPITFKVTDVLGRTDDVVIASGDVYHKALMREDGGWLVEDDSATPTFDFREMLKLTTGVVKGPDGEVYENYEYGVYEGNDVAICGFDVNRVTAYRKDAPFWDPGKVVQNETGQADLFGFTQTDPRSCVHGNRRCQECDDDNWDTRLKVDRLDREDRQ